ncbi:sugar ABC transporter substrate-binding protein [Paenibacillus sp. N4]|uniref:ABC transporter substrate-binding protein n=1 Tax=Paenibacillus vietnamensis TaxID=2590547 RepID=UPI001CD18A1F|nr:sugar ABC transporter substrate-binding protein [Paenibacillus vietnamensis]MCA0757601.1 sugar ABC transporter substrate-binding protein [Paenibacillus vietnamensis]
MKTWLKKSVAVSLLTVLAAGCSGGNGGETGGNTNAGADAGAGGGGKPTLTLWMKKQLFEDQNTMITERAKQFGEENNVNVNVEIIAYEDFYPKWTAAIESKSVPDVSFFGYQEVGQFYGKNVLENVSDSVGKLETANGEVVANTKKAVTFEGKQYGVPFWTETQVLYYRKDLLEAAGFSAPPATWEEFREMAKALTDTSKGLYGAGMGYGKGNSDAEFLTRGIIWSYGGSVDTKDGKTVIADSPETVQAASFIRDIFMTDKSTPPSALGWDDSGNNKAYLSGQAAMIFNTGSVLASIKKDNPDLYEKTGIAPYPAGPKGQFIPGISNYLGIFKDSKNKELAKELIEYMLDADWYKSWIEKGAPLTAPVYTELAKEPVWQDEKNKAFVESVSGFYFLGRPGEYNPKAGEVFNLRIVNDMFQKLMLESGYTPETAVKELSAKIQEVYGKTS